MTLKLIKYSNTPGTFEAEWLDGDKTLRVIAYSGEQIDLFRADVAKYGGEIDEALLAEVAAEWVPPQPAPQPVPQSVTRFQARAALHLAGLLEQVEAVIADPATPVLAKLAWQDAQEFKRTSPTIAAMSSALGLTDQQLADLFALAAGIDA